MTQASVMLYAVRDVTARELQLHVRPGARAKSLLFRWDVQPAPIDGGPTAAIVEIFAHALGRVETVAMLHVPIREARDGVWQTVDGDQWLLLSPTPLQRLRGYQRVALVATRRPERLRELFSEEVSWTQQAQVAFMFRNGQLPMLSHAQVMKVVTARDAEYSALSLPAEVNGLVMPAVDGDYLELVGPDEGLLNAVRDAVVTECERRGIPFEQRSDWR